ncbi:MAG: diaminopimelate decarboxylase [Phycisphaerae bacterium]|nr:diaminopimelate decarboxylase [Phycisphaerae bacterium]
MMDHFEYRSGELFCEQVAVAEIASAVGTPVYVYSAATLLHHYRAIGEAFRELRPTICFSVKSLSNIHILKLLASAGSGFDVVSGGELERVRAIGADASKVVFAGVAKTDREILDALAADIGCFNVESEEEFINLSRLAESAGRKATVALRINPDVYDPQTHRYTATGKKATKFGVDIDQAEAFFDRFGHDAHAHLEGIHFHLGSPIYSAEPYVQAITKTLPVIQRLREREFPLRLLNIGGGFAADYERGRSPAAADYAEPIVPLLRDTGLSITLEPGRFIACNAGLLLTSVQYVKQSGGRKFVIVDAAMTDLIRPVLYGAQHLIYPARLPAGAEPPQRRPDYAAPEGETVDIVGGVCETSDFLATDRVLPKLARGDLAAVFSAGAYGFVMASQYNSRPRAAEVLVEGDRFRLIRRRETHDDLLAPEHEV